MALETKKRPALQLPSCAPFVQAGVMLNQYPPGPSTSGVLKLIASEYSFSPRKLRPVEATVMLPLPDAMLVPPLPSVTPVLTSYVAVRGLKFASAWTLNKIPVTVTLFEDCTLKLP